MQRRDFLGALGALSAGGASQLALADNATLRAFQAALAQHPAYGVYVNQEMELEGEARVRGRWPQALRGSFYRNGPGRMELGGERYHHLFDGDGFAQRWEISATGVRHRGRFVQTAKFLEESRAGQFLYSGFGTYIGRRGVRGNDQINAANTNLLPFAGKLYALWEGGSATELDPQTLETRKLVAWREDLRSMPFCAHPKRARDGSLWNIGALPGSDKLALYHIGANGVLRNFAMLDLPDVNMQHDFAISDKYLILLIPPFKIQMQAGKSFLDSHQWQGDRRGMRAVLIRLSDLQIEQTFELPPHMVFHFGNAWDQGQDCLLDVVLHDGPQVLQDLAQEMSGQPSRPMGARSGAAQIRFDLANRKAHIEMLLSACEFPAVAPGVVGQRHRYLTLLSARHGAQRLHRVNVLDRQRGLTQHFDFGAEWQVEEHIIVPKRAGAPEGEAWLLGVMQNLQRAQTVLNLFDMQHVADGPQAQAYLPYHAPLCFHGNFLSA
ncbi:carotenoid oxygenase family protein [Massilia sp. W12]|uniref:carotenoid oxygenase family protein n=1 Tax=Massilia sp. W12 TaxID=3126507 RepID=UPI0030D42968